MSDTAKMSLAKMYQHFRGYPCLYIRVHCVLSVLKMEATYSVTSKVTVFFIVSAFRTSNLSYKQCSTSSMNKLNLNVPDG